MDNSFGYLVMREKVDDYRVIVECLKAFGELAIESWVACSCCSEHSRCCSAADQTQDLG